MRTRQWNIRILVVAWEGGRGWTRAERSGESLFIPQLTLELILGSFRQANVGLMPPLLYSDWLAAILIT
jgi:hypothetical protein